MTYQIKENSYGHLKRLSWIIRKLSPRATICEIGCGTGAMIVFPLVAKGFNAIGVDADDKSIQFGKEFFKKEGLPKVLYTLDEFAQRLDKFDVIIVSEVLEHIESEEYPAFFQQIKAKLKEGGQLIVTVPNGYGWFELESYLYFKKNIGKFLEKLKITYRIDHLKNLLLRKTDWVNTVPSTLCHSPHVQKFTHRSIQKLLKDHNFNISSITGSVLFAGPFSDLFFAGFNPILKLNNFLGSFLPILASGFYVDCRMQEKK